MGHPLDPNRVRIRHTSLAVQQRSAQTVFSLARINTDSVYFLNMDTPICLPTSQYGSLFGKQPTRPTHDEGRKRGIIIVLRFYKTLCCLQINPLAELESSVIKESGSNRQPLAR
ncbi:hypothetical protein F6R98_11100 [Candidatus Methylospira mobilis]|uniref:Uncharacterized protein n=1 Tax=Candidatus Methylospira mobilis TaxID=1808979 RepID=A0A5Q0BHR1_9GAMM|nr:hypothetical protein [Candidatus Methylospira mobilis]QFY43099.1 hypothetical protein F6R98_11100 [Candidatus Methylospira mobilis]WNV03756.1 hypothetical protein RP726_15120 [Candidatus Methylospira mobilis]